MKTSSTSSTRHEHKYSKATIDRAMQYASQAIFNSPILRKHYSAIAKTDNLRNPFEAAFQDYLKHQRQFKQWNKSL